MQKSVHDERLPSKIAAEVEKNLLKKFALKKVTVPQENLHNVANLTVQTESNNLEEWMNSSYKATNNSTTKSERLEYRDLSKVMRANIPWWLGSRGGLTNYSGERLASLVEITSDERKFENKRLEAGVEQEEDFKTIDSNCSVDVAEILSKGMEFCFTDAGPSVRAVNSAIRISESSNKTASKYHISDKIERCYKRKDNNVDIHHESSSKTAQKGDSFEVHRFSNESEVNTKKTDVKLETECENEVSTSTAEAVVESKSTVLTSTASKVEAEVKSESKMISCSTTEIEVEVKKEKVLTAAITKSDLGVESKNKDLTSAVIKLEAEIKSESKISISTASKVRTEVESENKAVSSTATKAENDSEHKVVIPDNSTDMAWIEERLDRVQKLLVSLEDLRLRSGCEKCRGYKTENSLTDGYYNDPSSRRHHGPNAKTREGTDPLPHASKYNPNDLNYVREQDSRTLSGIIRPSGSIVRAKICKCDLDVINNEMASLCCYLQNLAEKQSSCIEKSQVDIIIGRVQQIRYCFRALTNKIMAGSMMNSAAGSEIFQQEKNYDQQPKNYTALEAEDSDEYDAPYSRPPVRGSLAPNDNNSPKSRKMLDNVFEEGAHRASYAMNMEDNMAEMSNAECLEYCRDTKSKTHPAAGPMFLDPPAAWCDQAQDNTEGGCSPEVVFVPCFYYNPATGECKFTETQKQRPKYQKLAVSSNYAIENEQNSRQKCHCNTHDHSKDENVMPFRQKCPINTDDLLAPTGNLTRKGKEEITANKNEHRPEKQKGTERTNSAVESSFKRDMEMLSKQTCSQRKTINDQHFDKTHGRNRYVGEILSQDMKISQQRLDVEYNGDKENAATASYGKECSCRCKQIQQENPSFSREKFLATCRHRSTGAGFNEGEHDDFHNEASADRAKNLKSTDQTINGKTVIRVSTVCCSAPERQFNGQPLKSSRESTRWSGQEARSTPSKAPFKKSNPKPQVGYTEEQKKRCYQEHSKKTNPENDKRVSREPTSRQNQELQSAGSRSNQEFSRKSNREQQDVQRNSETSYRQPKRSAIESPKGVSIKLYGSQKRQPQNRTSQCQKKKLTFDSQCRDEVDSQNRLNPEFQSKTSFQRESFIKPDSYSSHSYEQRNLSNPQEKVSTPESEPNRSQNEKSDLESPRERSSETQTRKWSIKDSRRDVSQSNEKPNLSNENNLKFSKPTVSSKQKSNVAHPLEGTNNNPNDGQEGFSKQFGDICKELCDNSFQQLSNVCKQYYENPVDPDKQMCELPCRTLCHLCKNSCNGIAEKFTSNNVDQNTSNKENNNFESKENASENRNSLKSVIEKDQDCLFDCHKEHNSQASQNKKETEKFKEIDLSKGTKNVIQKPVEVEKNSKQHNDLEPVQNRMEAKSALKKPNGESFERSFNDSQVYENPKQMENISKDTNESVKRKSYEENCNCELLQNYEFCKDFVRPVKDIDMKKTLSRVDEFSNESQNPSRTAYPIEVSNNNKKPVANLQDIRICMSAENIRNAMPHSRDTIHRKKDTIPKRRDATPSNKDINSGTSNAIHNTRDALPNTRGAVSKTRDATVNNRDSSESVKSHSGGDAPKAQHCACCCCEGVPPIEGDLGTIIQNRIKHRKRGSVYIKFTMTSNNLFHIQMSTVDNEFLGCFYATENAVMEARRTNGFDGCVTLSVMEASNSPSQVSRLVDHAFMIVQQDSKSQ